tara:strand:- start:121 stop:288 length:168 start_codon:yes stop_codon:yes gene_type:complete
MISLATAVLLVVLGVMIGIAITKSPQRKWEYSGESRKKNLPKKQDTDTFQSGDLL